MSSSAAATASEEPEAEEAVLQLMIPAVSRLEDVALSKVVQLKGHQWRIMAVHREVTTKGSDTKKDVMGAYIQHVGPKTPPQQTSNWSIVVNASVTLVNQADTDKNFTKVNQTVCIFCSHTILSDFRHQYTRNSTDWGYSNFLRWKEVISPLRGFVKDDTILLHARLVCPGPDTHADSALSSSQSQSHSTSSLPTSSQSPVSQNHAHSLWPQGTGSNSTHHQTLPSFTRSLPQSLSVSSCVQSLVFSQSSQNSEGSQLTPTSTAVLPTEMAAFFSCPRCSERYKEEGKKAPNTLHCGHTFCLDCLEKMTVKGEGGNHQLTCATCGKEHSGITSDTKPWFPNHSMVQLISTVLSKAKHFCPTHQHDRNYYCFQDKALVCIYCAYHGEHATHQCQPVNEAKLTIRDRLRPVKIQAQGRATELVRRLRLMKDEMEGLKVQAQGSARLVEEYFQSVESALHRQRDLLLQDLHSHTSDLHNTLETQARDLEKHHSRVQRSLEEYDQWKSLPAREALSKVPAITHTLQTTATTSLPRDFQQAMDPRMRVTVELPCANLLSSLGPLGHVTVTCPSLSPSPGATDIAVEEAAPPATGEVNGVEPHDEGNEKKETQPADTAADSQSTALMDTQEGEDPVGGVLVKRTNSDASPSRELRAKKRKISNT